MLLPNMSQLEGYFQGPSLHSLCHLIYVDVKIISEAGILAFGQFRVVDFLLLATNICSASHLSYIPSEQHYIHQTPLLPRN